jgi:hypothetical protein
LPNCWRPIFLILPKLNGCQVDLPNYWSCSYISICSHTSTHMSHLFFQRKASANLYACQDRVSYI